MSAACPSRPLHNVCALVPHPPGFWCPPLGPAIKHRVAPRKRTAPCCSLPHQPALAQSSVESCSLAFMPDVQSPVTTQAEGARQAGAEAGQRECAQGSSLLYAQAAHARRPKYWGCASMRSIRRRGRVEWGAVANRYDQPQADKPDPTRTAVRGKRDPGLIGPMRRLGAETVQVDGEALRRAGIDGARGPGARLAPRGAAGDTRRPRPWLTRSLTCPARRGSPIAVPGWDWMPGNTPRGTWGLSSRIAGSWHPLATGHR